MWTHIHNVSPCISLDYHTFPPCDYWWLCADESKSPTTHTRYTVRIILSPHPHHNRSTPTGAAHIPSDLNAVHPSSLHVLSGVRRRRRRDVWRSWFINQPNPFCGASHSPRGHLAQQAVWPLCFCVCVCQCVGLCLHAKMITRGMTNVARRTLLSYLSESLFI